MQPTTLAPRQEAFVAEMTQRMADVARRLSAWAGEEARTLGDLEQHAVRLGKELGTAVPATWVIRAVLGVVARCARGDAGG